MSRSKMNLDLSEAQQDQLRELIDALLDDRADLAQQQQLDQLLADSDQAVEFYASYIDLHAALRWQRRGEDSVAQSSDRESSNTRSSRGAHSKRLHRHVGWITLATLAIVAWVFFSQKFEEQKQQPVTRFWNVNPVGDAQFVVNNDSIKLIHGEIHVQSIRDLNTVDMRPIVIETPVGIATARGTEFFIGTHSSKNLERKGQAVRQLTRVLILAGAVTLANDVGSIEGGPFELLAAEENSRPTSITVQSNSEFALDMYRELCSHNEEGNVFFSPYSLHVALTMALEGARGTTAEEMGNALRFPTEARQIGNDQQSIPWRVSLMHSGHLAIAKRFDREETDAEKTLRKRIGKLQKDLASKNLSVQLLSTFKQHAAAKRAEREAQDLADQINTERKKLNSLELNLANSLWGDQQYPFRAEFVDSIDKHYKTGGIFPADFRNSYPAQRKRINQWVSQHTGGKINDIMPSFDPPTVENLRLVLVNAIYFKGDWLTPFKANRTRPRDFALDDGRKIKVPTMAGYGYESARYGAVNADGSWFATPKTRIVGVPIREQKDLYPDEKGFQILSMPYRGDSISMIFILPRNEQSLNHLRKMTTSTRLAEWIHKLEQRKVTIRMPKFSLSTNYNMVPFLRSMGMERAFIEAIEPNGADFSAMCRSDDPRRQMHISQIIHRATVDVNENGTIATAASAIMMKTAEAAAQEVKRVPFTPQFYAERPFVVLIRDMQQGTILFMGHVNDPSK